MVEILVGLAILLFLLVIMIANIGGYREDAMTLECRSRMREVGAYYLGYAGEHNGIVRFFRGGVDSPGMWFEELSNYAGLREEEASSRFGCPLKDEQKNRNRWRCFGLRLEGSPGKQVTVPTETGQITYYQLALPAVQNPSEFYIFVDSVTRTTGNETFRIRNAGVLDGVAGVHAAHRGAANIFFLDGHIELASPDRFKSIGIRNYINSNREVVRVPNW